MREKRLTLSVLCGLHLTQVFTENIFSRLVNYLFARLFFTVVSHSKQNKAEGTKICHVPHIGG